MKSGKRAVDLNVAAKRKEAGESISALAREFKCDRKWLGQQLREETGKSFQRRIPAHVALNEAELNLSAAIKRVESGESISALAREFGCDRKRLSQRIREKTGKKTFLRRIKADVALIEVQLAEGRTITSLAADLDVAEGSLSAWLKRKTGQNRQLKRIAPEHLVDATTGQLEAVAVRAGVSPQTLRRRLADLDQLTKHLDLPLCLEGNRVFIDLPFRDLLKRIATRSQQVEGAASNARAHLLARLGDVVQTLEAGSLPGSGYVRTAIIALTPRAAGEEVSHRGRISKGLEPSKTPEHTQAGSR